MKRTVCTFKSAMYSQSGVRGWFWRGSAAKVQPPSYWAPGSQVTLIFFMSHIKHSSWCSFSMMVKWANDGFQAYDGKRLVYDGEMLVNDGEMSICVHSFHLHWLAFHHHQPSTSILPSLAWSKPSFAHLTIIEKLHRLHSM